jgi:arylsulfatase A-like enzyme
MGQRDERRGLTRKELLESAALATPAAAALGAARAKGQVPGPDPTSGEPFQGKNVLIFLTDQDRAIQHFPPGWARRNLPGYTRLQQNGVTFTNAVTNACMCSPARSTWLTGYFPAQHGVKYTLESDMPAPQYPQVELSTGFPNLATVMNAAGYNSVYKGKFHCVKMAGSEWVPEDVNQFGFSRWNPPDAGANQDISEAGGGTTDNDGRFMHSVGDVDAGDEGVFQYLETVAADQQPFFLIVSLVNPHDVLFYPGTYEQAGYDDSWIEGEIGLPATVNEQLLPTKPRVQEQFLRLFNFTGRLPTPQMKRNYLNFYGNLIKSSDAYLVQILDLLTRRGLLDDTVIIRTADHGEMGMTHGGMRQKNFNVYEEALRVPLIYSNPKIYPRASVSDALVSHVDFLPTLANLFGAPESAQAEWQGVDYSRIVQNPRSRRVQDYTVFTYDDYQSGQASGPYPRPPNHVVGIREQRWKIAKYYDAGSNRPNQWEMYDRRKDPNEVTNLADPDYKRTPVEEQVMRRLKRKLARVQRTRLQPLPEAGDTP